MDAGTVDPELFGNTGSQPVQDKAFQGKVGMTRFEWSLFMKDIYQETAKAIDPNASWVPMGPLATEAARSSTRLADRHDRAHVRHARNHRDVSRKAGGLYKVLQLPVTEEGNPGGLRREGEYHTVHENVRSGTDQQRSVEGKDLQSYIYNYQFTGRGMRACI